MISTLQHRAISSDLARSWLLTPGLNSDGFDTAASSDADVVVLDIEDAVDPTLKGRARGEVASWLEHNDAWVRINDRHSPYWADDVAELSYARGLAGVVLAKVEDPSAVTDTFDAFEGRVPVIALVESALGIEEAVAIARARGTHRLAFGSGDYRRDTGTSADDLAMAYPRSRLVVASRIGGLPGPIDGPTVGGGLGSLREQSSTGVSLGLTGKLCLHRDQAAVVNESFSPSQSDLMWANDFLADFAARGGVVRDGSDLPRYGRARRIEYLANAFHLSAAD